MLQYYFSLRQFRLLNAALPYIVLRITYIWGLILELSRISDWILDAYWDMVETYLLE